ncbi:hypothetical protein HNY73_018768 [Argiope bruennichi]|uniref:Uncharacterized protein n=1 Tax=Argiope bruennichi TaxID=94029 RepID=A0A8T0EE15_ARGBR|nr:hypothetical protein HNY73_018768 [Argiope bruennichi]
MVLVLTSAMNNHRPHHFKKPLPLKNPGTPRLPRIGLMDSPSECAMTTIVRPPTPKKVPPSPIQKVLPNLKNSDSKDSGIDSASASSVTTSGASRGKALFQSATMLLACYIRTIRNGQNIHFGHILEINQKDKQRKKRDGGYI